MRLTRLKQHLGCRTGWVSDLPSTGTEAGPKAWQNWDYGGLHPTLETSEPSPEKTEGWAEYEGRNHPRNA